MGLNSLWQKTKTVMYYYVNKLSLTFEFVVLRVRREEAVWEEFREGQAGVFWPVFHVVTHSWLQFLHELGRGRAKLLYNLIPLVDIWMKVESRKTPTYCMRHELCLIK